jgi:multidrug transporter EmrE-like cation transporter
MMRILRRLRSLHWLRIAAICTLVSLALMSWSLFQPTPMPVMVAMTVGQGIGMVAFGAYGWVVFRDITRQRAERRSSQRIELVKQEDEEK